MNLLLIFLVLDIILLTLCYYRIDLMTNFVEFYY